MSLHYAELNFFTDQRYLAASKIGGYQPSVEFREDSAARKVVRVSTQTIGKTNNVDTGKKWAWRDFHINSENMEIDQRQDSNA